MKVILNVSHTPLSIARHSGGAKVNGLEYTYIPPFDALILKSLVKPYNKFCKERKGQPAKQVWEQFLEAVKNEEL